MRFALGFFIAAGAIATVACGARSRLDEERGFGGNGPLSLVSTIQSGAGGSGGNDVASPVCVGGLVLGPIQTLDEPAGTASAPQLVFGSDNGDVVSVVHIWQGNGADPPELRSTTIQPWSNDLPAATTFTLDPEGGYPFAVSNVSYGNISIALRHVDPVMNLDSLGFTESISATSPGELLTVDLATSEEHALPIKLVRGYDNPPVAFNVGYLATLITWDSTLPQTDTHALRMAVGSSGSNPLSGTVSHDGEALACANAPIAADGIRAGSSWLVATASGSDFGDCEGVSLSQPTSLAIDQVTWGPADTVNWTVDRLTSIPGSEVIDAVHMTRAPSDGGWIVVQRHAKADLELMRIREDGSIGKTTTVSSKGQTIAWSNVSALDDGVIVTLATLESPSEVTVELFDAAGSLVTTATTNASDAIGPLSVLQAMDGHAALLAWANAPGHLQTMRIDCKAPQ